MAKRKYYVVWNGVHPGVYDTWEACRQQVQGFENARYKSFDTHEAAREAYEQGYNTYNRNRRSSAAPSAAASLIRESLAVDAACSGNPGDMEYRGVYVATGEEIFRVGPYRQGTNNIGEFLAIVHGLALLDKQGRTLPLYSDSHNAIGWVRQKRCKTRLQQTPENRPLFDLIERAEAWLATHTWSNPILKWDTENWGENPADFGRK